MQPVRRIQPNHPNHPSQFPGAFNTIQNLLDLDVDTAAAIVSLLPTHTRKAIHTLCRASRAIVQRTLTTLTLSLEDLLSSPVDASTYPAASTLVVKAVNAAATSDQTYELQKDGKELHPVLQASSTFLANLQRLTVHDVNFRPLMGIDGSEPEWPHLVWGWAVSRGLMRLMSYCTSLCTFELFCQDGKLPAATLTLPEGSTEWAALVALLSRANSNTASAAPGTTCLDLTLPQLIALPPFQHCLSKLVLRGCGFADAALEAAVRGAKNLRHLELYTDDNACFGQLPSSPLPHLTTLRLYGTWFSTSYELRSFHRMAEQHAQLRELSFHTNMLPETYVHRGVVKPFLMSNLTELEMLGMVHELWDLGGLKGLTNLKMLSLYDMQPSSAWCLGVLYSLTALLNLQTLCFRFKNEDRPCLHDNLSQQVAIERRCRQQGSSVTFPSLETIQAETENATDRCNVLYDARLSRTAQTTVMGVLLTLDAPKLTNVQAHLAPFHVAELLEHFPSLKLSSSAGLRVEVDGGAELMMTAKCWPHLLAQPGVVLHCNLVAHDIISTARMVGRQLTHLDLTSAVVEDLRRRFLEPLGHLCPSLRVLGLKAMANTLHVDNIYLMIELLWHLRHLHLEGCWDVDDALLDDLPGLCPQLRHLELDGLEEVSEEALVRLTQLGVGEEGKVFVIRGPSNLTYIGEQKLEWCGWRVSRGGV